MRSKRLIELQDQLDFDYNIVSVELDTCPKRLRYISTSDLSDAADKDAFDTFFNSVRHDEAVVVSINDNTDMYELSENAVVVVLHETQTAKYILFDLQDVRKVEDAIFSNSYN